MSRAQKIVDIARGYIGIIEIKPNKGFGNKAFEKLMIGVGFYVGAPWCAFFTKLIYTLAYADHAGMKAVVNSCASGNAQATYRNFQANGTFATGQEPRVGAIAIWQNGNSKTSGHAAIVESFELSRNTMTCIEGNTNASGSREGDRCARKLRTISRPRVENGLNLIGFIYPFEVK